MTVLLDELFGLGFEQVTEWIRDGAKIRLADLSWQEHGGWIYAFTVDEEVKYIGMTDRVLRSRMDNYRDAKHEQTSRLRELILAELSTGRRVQIYGRRQRSPRVEETSLIAHYRPSWNR